MIKKLLVLAIAALFISSCTPDELEKLDGTHVKISGTLRQVGTHPFIEIAISGPNQEAIILKNITPNQEKILLEMMGREVTLPGTLSIDQRQTADNKYTVTDYFLTLEN